MKSKQIKNSKERGGHNIMQKSKKRNLKSSKGITLIALVVTIVVLLILAGVSINAIFSDNGLIQRARNLQNTVNEAQANEKNAIANLIDEINNAVDKRPLVTTLTDIQETTVIARDPKGNQVVMPKGFKISSESGTSVQQGIVVEDGDDNQYVWVPVSNIDASGNNKIILDNGDLVEITLGRYTFDAIYHSDSAPTGTGEIIELKQKGSEWATETAFSRDSSTGWTETERKDARASNGRGGLDGTNTTAKNLQEFVESVRDNHGYYIARYEASKEDGTSTTRLASKANVAVWNNITQGSAAIVCKNMYTEAEYNEIECDLMNSFAWDTAIVYIQKCKGDISYSKANDGVGSSPSKTGTKSDEKCKINDMAKNVTEWTTEYSSSTISTYAYPCVCRGGLYYGSSYFVSYRSSNGATGRSTYVGFRPLLYVK